jgi:hypothetical protein
LFFIHFIRTPIDHPDGTRDFIATLCHWHLQKYAYRRQSSK